MLHLYETRFLQWILAVCMKMSVLGRSAARRQFNGKFQITPEATNFPEKSVYFSHHVSEDSELKYVQAFPASLPTQQSVVRCVFVS